MISNVPVVNDCGDSIYTMMRDYDHIIASLDVAIDNIGKSHSLRDQKNSASPPHHNNMVETHTHNLKILIKMKEQYLVDRDIFTQMNKLQYNER